MNAPLKFIRTSGVSIMALLGVALAGGEGWTSDFAAAEKLAAEKRMDLLLDFTGSDWCDSCIKLNDEVFKKDAFKEGVKDHFVLVEIDSPQDESRISAATRKQNAQLIAKYAVECYPTILLCDAEGRPYASAGYKEGGPEKYVAMLDGLRVRKTKRDEGFAAAGKAEGIEKAKLLAGGLDMLELEPARVSKFYPEVIARIKATDPDDKTGFSKRLAVEKRFRDYKTKLDELLATEDMTASLAWVDKTLKEGGFTIDQTLEILKSRLRILIDNGDYDEAFRTIDRAKALAPKHPMISDFEEARKALEEERRQGAGDAAKGKAKAEKSRPNQE